MDRLELWRFQSLHSKRIRYFIVILAIWLTSFVLRYTIAVHTANYQYLRLRGTGGKCYLLVFWFLLELFPVLLFLFLVYITRTRCTLSLVITVLFILLTFGPALWLNMVTAASPFCSYTTNADYFGVYDQDAQVASGFPEEIPPNASDVTYEYVHSLYTSVFCQWNLPQDDFEKEVAHIQASYPEVAGKYGYKIDAPTFSLWITVNAESNTISYYSYAS